MFSFRTKPCVGVAVSNSFLYLLWVGKDMGVAQSVRSWLVLGVILPVLAIPSSNALK